MKPKHFDKLVRYLNPIADKKTLKAARRVLTDDYSIRGAASFFEVDNSGVYRQVTRIKELYELCESIAKDLNKE